MNGNLPNTTKNLVSVVGKVDREFDFSHEYYGEGFYKTNLLVDRLNETNDRIPVMVSDRLLDMDSCYAGKYIFLDGEFRSYNIKEEDQAPKKHQLMVFAHDIRIVPGDEVKKISREYNIYIEGFLCRPPVYRVTPQGREITELMLSVQRRYGKSDYIPCICWGRNARYAAGFHMGDKVSVNGRIQSRDYTSRSREREGEKITVNEVSVKRISRAGSDDQ